MDNFTKLSQSCCKLPHFKEKSHLMRVAFSKISGLRLSIPTGCGQIFEIFNQHCTPPVQSQCYETGSAFDACH